MRIGILFAIILTFGNAFFYFRGELSSSEQTSQKKHLESFTGRIKSNRVRLRTEPHTNSNIIRELNRGDLFNIVDEVEDFYAVQPPQWVKAYVYRTFVIDNVIEGNKVNVRTAPTLEAPVIAQLNTGDRVEGMVCSQNPRWLKIKTPESARFYISKVFVENIGPPEYMETLEKRQQEIDFLLMSAQKMGQEELEKHFEDIQLEETYGYLDKVIQDYAEFPNQVTKAKKLTQEFQQAYLQKKIAFLEEKAQKIADSFQPQTSGIDEEIRFHQQQLVEVENEIQNQKINSLEEFEMESDEEIQKAIFSGVTAKMAAWYPMEEKLFQQWISLNNNDRLTKEDFYREEKKEAIGIQGIIEPYQRAIKNKPGDYQLINSTNRLPVAYLYSTKVNLQDYAGQQVSLLVSERPNNHFAFPAYFVLEVEQMVND